MATSDNYQSVLELSSHDARRFFLKNRSYCSIELPPYYDFQELIDKISSFYDEKLKGNPSFKGYLEVKNRLDMEVTNHHIYSNKNGSLSWREFQIIHPIMYVGLVYTITEDENWIKLTDRFNVFQEDKKVKCLSLPLESLTRKSDKTEKIIEWWRNVEQQSIELALKFEYLYDTDIADCYGSIYTHSIAWAVETKETAKLKRKDKTLLGNRIDYILMLMQQGQTNGIAQGSELMDFLAEVLLGYIDNNISLKLEDLGIKDYQILRYRDDYRVFVNNPLDGSVILKTLAEKLLEVGMRLNGEKTRYSNDVISAAIKPDKTYWLSISTQNKKPQQTLLLIRNLSKKYPNSGTLRKELRRFYANMAESYNNIDNFLSDISIVTDITYYNPTTYTISFAIISKFLSMIDDVADKNYVIDSINCKFKKLPNTGFMHIWFKRMLGDTRPDIKFDEKLCSLIDQPVSLWNNDWVGNQKLLKIVNDTPIFNKDNYESLSPVIQPKEFFQFGYQ